MTIELSQKEAVFIFSHLYADAFDNNAISKVHTGIYEKIKPLIPDGHRRQMTAYESVISKQNSEPCLRD